MADFAVTADPQRFDEAVEWFRKRTVLTREDAAKLGAEAGRRAFWIGGGLQLAQVQRVFDKLGKAVEDGTPFDEWRKSVKDELRSDAHAETVFRNATQRSLNAGRWRQMREPGVLEHRPFWLFDGIADSRQSPVCKECDGTILPAEHPWWATHTPLLHHRCRSSIRNLRRSEAQRRGITAQPPSTGADKGFGLSPEDEPDWKPDPSKTDPALLRELERKKDKPRPAPKKPKEAPPEHDLGHWEKHYDRYGDAAPTVAWGRTMLERGLDRPAGEVVTELERLQKAGVPGDYARLIGDLKQRDPSRPLRKQLLTPRERYAVMMSEHSRSIQRGGVLEIGGEAADDRRIQEAKRFYGELADKSVKRPVGWGARVTEGQRAYASAIEEVIELGDEGTPITVHEIAHTIEFSDPRALKRSLGFLRSRTKGEELQSLTQLTGVEYGEKERARPDKFVAAYIGKDYGDTATELTAVGYQALSGDNMMLKKLQERDEEMLFFLTGQLAGR